MHAHVYELVEATGVHTPAFRQGADAHGDVGAGVVTATSMRRMSETEHWRSSNSRAMVVGKTN